MTRLQGVQIADQGFDHTRDHSLDSHYLRDPDHGLRLQPVRGASGLCSADAVCFLSRHAAFGAVDVEGTPGASNDFQDGLMNASEKIDQLIAGIADWRGKTLASVRKAVRDADEEIVEEWKWMGSPVWSRDGIIAVGNAHKDKVKLTFDHGARLPDPERLFNAGLEGNQRRAIDFFEGDKVNAPALKALVRSAIAYNQSRITKKAAKRPPKKRPESLLQRRRNQKRPSSDRAIGSGHDTVWRLEPCAAALAQRGRAR
jgi:hypothetical protein